ncbi:hypothetical protein D3C71_1160060 [compost metagenome]
MDLTQGTGLRCVVARLTRGVSLLPTGAAHWLQALLVGEAGQRQLTDRLGLVVAEVGQHHTAAVDGQVGDLTRCVAVLRRNGARGIGVELRGLVHGYCHARRISGSAVSSPNAIGDFTRNPAGDFQIRADDWRRARRGDRNQLAAGIESHGRRNRTSSGVHGIAAIRVATIDQGIDIPGIGPGLDHVLIHDVLVTLRIEDLGRELLGESGSRLARVERVGHRVDHISLGIQVDRRRNGGGGFRRQVGCIDAQVRQYTIDDLAIGIHAITLQTGSAVSVGDVAFLVDLERTGAGVGQRTVVVQHKEAGAVDAHVQHVAGVVDVALGELLGNVGQAHATAGGLAACAQPGGRVHIFEFRAGRFEADSRDVGDVVAGHVQLLVGGIETAKADVERHIPLLCAGLVGSIYQWFVLWTAGQCPVRPDSASTHRQSG